MILVMPQDGLSHTVLVSRATSGSKYEREGPGFLGVSLAVERAMTKQPGALVCWKSHFTPCLGYVSSFSFNN